MLDKRRPRKWRKPCESRVANHGLPTPHQSASLDFRNIRVKLPSGLTIGWSRMSGRRTSGTSRPSLGVQVLALFSFVS